MGLGSWRGTAHCDVRREPSPTALAVSGRAAQPCSATRMNARPEKPVPAAQEPSLPEGQRYAPPSPRNGNRLPIGAHPGNTGGKRKRSGRKPDAFRRALEDIRDEKGIGVLEQVLDGELAYTLCGVCEHCGKPSSGPKLEELLKLVPSPDTRLRAAEMTMRYTVGSEKTIRLEGIPGAQAALEVIKGRIRAKLAAAAAEELIEDIHHALRSV